MADRILPEFIGKARAIRERIASADERQFGPARDAAYASLRRRIQQKPTFREPECRDLLRHWQQAGETYGQINVPRMNYSKHSVRFSTVRLLGTEGQSEDWADGERETGISMAMVHLSADGKEGTVALNAKSLAIFSLHALARYYQRAFQSSDDALIAAMWGVLPDIKELITATTVDEFGLPVVAAGGHWFGWINPVVHVENNKSIGENDALNVRTFHTDRQDSNMWVRHTGTSDWVALAKPS